MLRRKKRSSQRHLRMHARLWKSPGHLGLPTSLQLRPMSEAVFPKVCRDSLNCIFIVNGHRKRTNGPRHVRAAVVRSPTSREWPADSSPCRVVTTSRGQAPSAASGSPAGRLAGAGTCAPRRRRGCSRCLRRACLARPAGRGPSTMPSCGGCPGRLPPPFPRWCR